MDVGARGSRGGERRFYGPDAGSEGWMAFEGRGGSSWQAGSKADMIFLEEQRRRLGGVWRSCGWRGQRCPESGGGGGDSSAGGS